MNTRNIHLHLKLHSKKAKINNFWCLTVKNINKSDAHHLSVYFAKGRKSHFARAGWCHAQDMVNNCIIPFRLHQSPKLSEV